MFYDLQIRSMTYLCKIYNIYLSITQKIRRAVIVNMIDQEKISKSVCICVCESKSIIITENNAKTK